MKRILTIVSVLSLVLAAGAMAEPYGWTVSLSSTDPDVNSGPAGGGFTTTTFYLWLKCSTDPLPGGAAAAGMTATVAGGAFPGGFNNEAFVLNAGDGTNLQLAIGGCPAGPIVVGNWGHLNTDGSGISVCLEAGGLTVDCDQITPTEYPHASIGATTIAGDAPCVVGELCPVVSNEEASWGSIKGLYR
ncbi:hypothetical protein K8I85_07260 [bacterium]|nr:hypothetical protein [bacterium]